jgi:tetratricopeptide (TPR) repeat protein
MAPEQARGQTDLVDERSDVFGLGGILCEILTGRPPYGGQSSAEILNQAEKGDTADALARLDGCGAEAELIALCKDCLAAERAARPRDARAVAERVQVYHAGVQARLKKAELERTAAEAREQEAMATAAAEQKARRRTRALAAATLLLVLAAGTGAWFLQQQRATARAHQEQTDREARALLERARSLLETGWRAHDRAKLTQARAEGDRAADIARTGAASEAVQQETTAFQKESEELLTRWQKNEDLLAALLDVSTPPETRAFQSDASGRMLLLVQPSVDEQYAAAFRRWGLDMDGTADSEVIATLGREPDAVVQEVIAGLDGWMLERWHKKRPVAEWGRLYRITGELDRDDTRRQLRALVLKGSPPRPEGVAGLLGATSPWAVLWELARGKNWRVQELRGQMDLTREPVLTVLLLAQAYRDADDAVGAVEVLRRAAAVRPDQVVLLQHLARLLEQQKRWEEAIGSYRAIRAKRPGLGIALGKALVEVRRAAEGETVMRDLVRRQPDNPEMHFHLGAALYAQQKWAPTEAAYRKAIDLKPDYAEAHNNLGITLHHLGSYAEAEAALRQAIKLRPDDAAAYNNLGAALNRQEKRGEAELVCRKAIELQADYLEAYLNLGNALDGMGKPGEAEAVFRKAIAFKPDSAAAYSNLGCALYLQGKHRAAEAACRKAIALQPHDAAAYSNLGAALHGQGKFAAAEAACREAIALEPTQASAYGNLGAALFGQGKLDAAEAACRKAVDLEFKRDAIVYNILGRALSGQRKHGAAEAAFRQAIDFKPNFAPAYHGLGLALNQQAQFDEALAAMKKCRDLLSATDPRRQEVQQLLQQYQRQVSLNARLPAVLQGTEKPATAAEQLEFAQLCALKKFYAAAARLSRDAFTAEPKLAEAVPLNARYNAACAAALAGCKQGKDADKLDDSQRARWRQQALDWLRADLTWWANAHDGGSAQVNTQVRQELRHWQADPDFAGLRDREKLDTLSETEQQQWRLLWADVNALLKKVDTSK